jgi:hypothetical protein
MTVKDSIPMWIGLLLQSLWAGVVFMAGVDFGKRWTIRRLLNRREDYRAVVKERDELRTHLEKAKRVVAAKGLDPKKVFPWL